MSTSETTIGLNNSAVALNNTTTLHCRYAFIDCEYRDTSKSNIAWRMLAPGAPKDLDILKKVPNRISNNATCLGQYDLTIRNVKFEDAGTYLCITLKSQYAAELIVIGE